MKVIFLATFLLIISAAKAISNEEDDLNMNFTSKDRSISHRNKQAHELIGNLYGNDNIEVSTRPNPKVAIMESNNEHKHELSVTIRKGGGVRAGGGRGGGFGLGRAGGAAAAGVGTGVSTGVIVDHGTHHSNSSATSLYAGPYFYVSTFILCVNFWL